MSEQQQSIDAPDIEMIPKSLRCLDWQPLDKERLYEDGERLLVAVAVCWSSEKHAVCVMPQPRVIAPNGRDWYYEISVVVICCDEDYFAIENVDGESWGWSFDDIALCVRIT